MYITEKKFKDYLKWKRKVTCSNDFISERMSDSMFFISLFSFFLMIFFSSSVIHFSVLEIFYSSPVHLDLNCYQICPGPRTNRAEQEQELDIYFWTRLYRSQMNWREKQTGSWPFTKRNEEGWVSLSLLTVRNIYSSASYLSYNSPLLSLFDLK